MMPRIEKVVAEGTIMPTIAADRLLALMINDVSLMRCYKLGKKEDSQAVVKHKS